MEHPSNSTSAPDSYSFSANGTGLLAMPQRPVDKQPHDCALFDRWADEYMRLAAAYEEGLLRRIRRMQREIARLRAPVDLPTQENVSEETP